MSKENKNNASVDPKSAEEAAEQNSLQEQEGKDSLDTIKPQMEEEYASRLCITDLINMAEKRRVNLGLILTQFFCRYSSAQIIGFFTGAVFLIAIQGKLLESDYSVSTILFLGALTTILMIAFIGVTLKNIVSALIDVNRLKHGYCCLGYQILYAKENNQANSDSVPFRPLVAYKDYSNMIRTLNLSVKNYKKYLLTPILELFLDNSDPYKVTFLENMPKPISYKHETKTFSQSWYGLKYALIPVAMFALYAISMYMCYIAYAAHH